MQLHRDLYKFLGNTEGRTFKTGDNIIREMDAEGNQHVRFMPVAAWETPDAIDELCNSFRDAKEIVDPLILDMMFILDFFAETKVSLFFYVYASYCGNEYLQS